MSSVSINIEVSKQSEVTSHRRSDNHFDLHPSRAHIDSGKDIAISLNISDNLTDFYLQYCSHYW